MTIPQDTFNKLVTVVLLLYTMIMFTLSWWLGKPLNLESFFVLIAPLVTHTLHIVTGSVDKKTTTNGHVFSSEAKDTNGSS